MEKVLTTYFDPIDSFPLSEVRAGIFPAGRYRGFDTIVAGTQPGDIPIVVKHTATGFTKTADDNTTSGPWATVISPHGTIIQTDQDYELVVAANPTSIPKFVTIYMEFQWVDNNPATFSVESITGNFTVPHPEYQIILAGIVVPPGASQFSDLPYYPTRIPNIGNADIIQNNSILAETFAQLNNPNYFLKENTFHAAVMGGIQILTYSANVVNRYIIMGIRSNTIILNMGGHVWDILGFKKDNSTYWENSSEIQIFLWNCGSLTIATDETSFPSYPFIVPGGYIIAIPTDLITIRYIYNYLSSKGTFMLVDYSGYIHRTLNAILLLLSQSYIIWADLTLLNGTTAWENIPQLRGTIAGEIVFKGGLNFNLVAPLATAFASISNPSLRPLQPVRFIVPGTIPDHIAFLLTIMIDTDGQIHVSGYNAIDVSNNSVFLDLSSIRYPRI